ncbi:MAG: 50S ribosomal protein L28 [Dehalococcoidia bacterium]|nr:50S ribosomal protein L28 [Dehalococcoidia bacterium]
MAKCQFCSKGPQFGNNVSHSHRKTRRRWNVNVQRVSRYDADGTRTRVRMCTRCLRTVAKTGKWPT